MSQERSKLRTLRRAPYFVIMVGFLFLIFRKMNLSELGRAVNHVSFGFLVPAIIVYLSGFYLRAVKWGVIIRSLKDTHPRVLLKYILIGCSGNALLPARMGEVLRAWIAGREESLPSISLFSTILVERFLEVISLMFLFSITISRLSMASMQRAEAIIIIIIVLGFAVLAASCFMGDRVKRLAQRSIPWERPRTMFILYFGDFVSGVRILRTPLRLLWVIVLGLGVYLIEGLAYWGIAQAFHIDISLFQVFFLVSFLFIGLMIPSTVGNIGPLQYFCILGLSYFGIAKGTALVYSVFLNLLMYIPAVIGLLYLCRFGISYKDLRARARAGGPLSEGWRPQRENP